MYSPREDTKLILDQIRKYAKGNVLDIGTGTGVLAIKAASSADFVYGVDINKKAIEYAEKASQGMNNIKFIKSNLFNYFKKHPEKFDLIIFNPPYLPEDIKEPKEIKLATTGGKKGYELLDKFLKQANSYLKSNGKILILFSSLTGYNHIHETMEKYAYSFQKLAEASFFFETLYVYLLEKSKFLLSLEEEGITNVEKLTKGHRGLIYTGKLNKKIAIKRKNPESKAVRRIENEALWIKFLNKYKIGPKFILQKDDYFVYKFVNGVFFPEFIENANKSQIKQIIKEVFRQCYQLDKLKINKEEMHHPYKHIIIDKKSIKDRKSKTIPKVVLLDFERTHKTLKPHNTTQFCQYIISGKISPILKKKGFKINKSKIISASKKYKKHQSETNFKNIISLL